MRISEEIGEDYANSLTRESGRFSRSDVKYAFYVGYKEGYAEALETRCRYPKEYHDAVERKLRRDSYIFAASIVTLGAIGSAIVLWQVL